MNTKFLLLARKSEKFVRDTYRYLHQHPELSFQEYNTSAFIKSELERMGITYRDKIADTGILGRIEGVNPQKRVVALRADIDALPIAEKNDISFRSQHDNVMHACGHDAHTACLLGAARILDKLKNEFEGTVLLIFQPGEEKAPGGAGLMLREGVFDEVKPDVIVAQHVSVDYGVGELAFATGKIMASADEVHITVKGKGGHGALPHLCNDTVLAASQTIVALQQIKSRLCPPQIPMILTFGKILAEGATNIIPNEVKISGTFRTFDEAWRIEAKEHIRRIATETCLAYGCEAKIEIPAGYPCVVNDKEITNRAEEAAVKLIGSNNVKGLEQRMTSEDFGFFSQQYPCCFYRFGVKGKSNFNAGGLHTSTFCIDEDALEIGTAALAWIALEMLK
ncbi:MAG: M20 family metallopeptidase [Paludibacteraceae bacterium]